MKTRIIKYLVMSLLCLLPGLADAQTRITGTVVDDMGPIAMANVVEVDGNNRNVSYTQTDVNGNFSLDIKNTRNKLRVTYVGYKSYSKVIGNTKTFNITLQSQTQIEDVVVVAKQKFNHGGLEIPENEVSMAQQRFDMSEVEGLGFTSADEALQGQIAGLDIVANSGNLGAGTSMRLRGVTTINGNSEPLIVVDGNIFETTDEAAKELSEAVVNGDEEAYSSLLSVNPSDIASISVLKDAAATAIWGSRGSNGVIEITTKRGSRGKIRVDYSLRVQASWQPKGYNLLNGDDYTMMLKEMYYNPSQDATRTQNVNEINYNPSWAEFENWNNNTDWVKEVKQLGFSQYHYFTISGGGEKANFRVSAGYDHQNGSIIKQTLDRFSTKLTLDYFVSDRIKFSTSFPLTYTRNNSNYTGLLGIAQKLAPNMSIYRQDANGNNTDEYYIMLPPGANDAAGSSAPNTSSTLLGSIRGMGNPIAIAHQAWRRDTNYRISPNFNISYDLLGTGEGQTRLRYNGQVYFDIHSGSAESYYPGSLKTNGWTDGDYNSASTNDNAGLSLSTNHTLYFTPAFHNRDLSASMMIRGELRYNNNTSQNESARNLPPGITTPTAGGNLSGLGAGNGVGHGLNAVYSGHFAYKSRYIFDFTIRADGSTSFGKANKWQYYPGISGRWNIGDEPIVKKLRPYLSQLSFRPSWGIGGRQPSANDMYAQYRTDGSYGGGNRNESVTYLTKLELMRVKPERTMQWNFGTDFGFFNDRITGNFNYYYKHTTDLLMGGQRIPSTTGFTTVSSANVGAMSNKGWELYIRLNRIIRVGKFSLDASANIAQNFNKINEMDDDVLEDKNPDWNPNSLGNYLNRIQVGNALGSIFGYRSKGVYQYSYEWLTDQRDLNGWNADQFRDFINNFLAEGHTAPVAVDKDGHVMMNRNGNPIQLVYNYRNGAGYAFHGGDAIYEDVNHDGQINNLDIVYLGNSNPKFEGGFNINLNYGRWRLRTSFSYRAGFYEVNKARMELENMYNANNASTAVNWRWRKEGDVTVIPRALFNTGYNWLGSDRYVEKGNFIRMSHIQLGYDFPKKIISAMGLNRLSLNLALQNPFCWTHYSGLDPEHSGGAWGVATDNSQTPRSKSVTLNLNVGF